MFTPNHGHHAAAGSRFPSPSMRRLFALTLGILLTLWLGPVGPAAAQLPNLTYYYHANWDYPLLPTASLHTPPEVRLPAFLFGNVPNTYLNFIGINKLNASFFFGKLEILIFGPGFRFICFNNLEGFCPCCHYSPHIRNFPFGYGFLTTGN